MTHIPSKNSENIKAQMRKGTLGLTVLLIIKRGRVYTGDIISVLKDNQLVVVEGTLYPLLSKFKREGLISHEWQESESGPPRKYFSLTAAGRHALLDMQDAWSELERSMRSLINQSK